MRRFSPLGVRIFFFSALAITFALGLTVLLIRAAAARAADASIERALAATEAAIHDKLAARSRQLLATARGLAAVSTYASRVEEALRAGDHGTLLDAANEFRDQLGAEWTLLTDRNGILAAWSGHPERAGNDLAGGSLIGLALQGAPTEGVWIEPTDAGDALYQAVGVPLRPPGGGATFGVLVAALPVDAALAEQLRRTTSSEIVFFVRDTAGTPVPNVATLPSPPDLAAALGRDTAALVVSAAAGGDRWVGSIAPLRTASGSPIAGVVGLRSRRGELAAYLALERAVWIAFAGGLLVSLASSAWLAGRITRPVGRLVEAIRRARAGDYGGRVGTDASDEIGELSRAFQHLVDELAEKQRVVAFLSGGGAGRADRPVGDSGDGDAGRAVTTSVPVLEQGTVLAGRYELLERIGSGGMGVVYRARDRQLSETIALKLLRPELSHAAPDLVERFRQEIRLARRITHRNVVRTHDFGEASGIHFITMEYVDGTPLDRLLRQRGALPVDVALAIGKQLCRALEVAHDVGVVHRDIKPGNLVLDAAGVLKVMDFGIARIAEGRPRESPTLTQAGALVGSPEYMAPEQLLGEEVDHRADLYATGCVLYECLTGQPVRRASNLYALIARHLDEPVPDPAALVPDVPEALGRIVQRALAPERQARWQSATELLDALEQVSQPVPA